MPKSTPDFDSSELELYSRLPGRASLCPPLDVLLALEQDALPAELAEPARAHLAGCSLCTMLLTDFTSLPEAELSAGQQKRIAASLPTAKNRASVWSMGAGLAAVAAVVLVMAGSFLIRGIRKSEIAQVQQASMPPVSQQQEIPFEPLASPSGSAALLTRGSGPDGEPANEQLLPAFRAYNHGDYALAAKQFGTLSEEYPQSGMVLLYLGVSQLALQQNEQADKTLRRARDASRPYDVDAVRWYSAVAASRVHSTEARSLLEKLCRQKASVYSARSCEALR